MAAAWELELGSTDKLVLLALADWSNDDGICWPSNAQLCRKSGLSERAVRQCIGRLKDAGHLTRDEVPGKGVTYTVHLGRAADDTPARGAPGRKCPRHVVPKTPARGAPNTLGTTNTSPKAKPSERMRAAAKRASALPTGFKPEMAGKTAAVVDGWPPGRLDDEIDAFTDYHQAKGTISKDWQASWRTWVRNSKKWEPRNGRQSAFNRPSAWAARPGMEGAEPASLDD